MELRILYDRSAIEGYQADWGFSCMIEADERVLFDTGADPDILRRNMQAAGIEPAQIDTVFISHDHWDHTGGLGAVTGPQGAPAVYLLPSFGPEARKLIRPPTEVREAASTTEICPHVFSTGPVGGQIAEQAMWLDTAEGVVLLVGCAHPGLDALMYAVESDECIRAVIGGFHGFRNFEILQDVPVIAPCHCTQFRKDISEKFPDSFRDIRAGSHLSF